MFFVCFVGEAAGERPQGSGVGEGRRGDLGGFRRKQLGEQLGRAGGVGRCHERPAPAEVAGRARVRACAANVSCSGSGSGSGSGSCSGSCSGSFLLRFFFRLPSPLARAFLSPSLQGLCVIFFVLIASPSIPSHPTPPPGCSSVSGARCVVGVCVVVVVVAVAVGEGFVYGSGMSPLVGCFSPCGVRLIEQQQTAAAAAAGKLLVL